MTLSYCTSQQIQDYLGKTLSASQLIEADVLAAAATEHCDRLTHRTWQNTGSVASELVGVEGPFIFLKHRPVVAITNMTAQDISVSAPVLPLVSGVDYRLVDAAAGMVTMMNWWNLWITNNRDTIRDIAGSHLGKLVSVDYTTSEAVPKDIVLAATMIAADWLQPTMTPEMSGYKQISISGAVSVTMADRAVPALVTEILAGYRKMVFA